MKQNQISVLFARRDSIYKELGCDVWDIDRDALNWPGGSAAIFHPPCRAWGRLRWNAKPRGAGTTALVARKLNRNYVGFELNAEYIRIAEKRMYSELGMFE